MLEYGLMNEAQRTAIMKLLREVLRANEVLRQNEPGAGAMFGYGYYFVSFLGTPSETDP